MYFSLDIGVIPFFLFRFFLLRLYVAWRVNRMRLSVFHFSVLVTIVDEAVGINERGMSRDYE